MFAVYTVYIYTTDTTYQLEVLRMGRREPQKDTTTEEKKPIMQQKCAALFNLHIMTGIVQWLKQVAYVSKQ